MRKKITDKKFWHESCKYFACRLINSFSQNDKKKTEKLSVIRGDKIQYPKSETLVHTQSVSSSKDGKHKAVKVSSKDG